MLKHVWLQGTLLGGLFLAWMIWHGWPRQEEPRTGIADRARCANSKDLS